MTSEDFAADVLADIDDRLEALPVLTAFDALALIKHGIQNRIDDLRREVWGAR